MGLYSLCKSISVNPTACLLSSRPGTSQSLATGFVSGISKFSLIIQDTDTLAVCLF